MSKEGNSLHLNRRFVSRENTFFLKKKAQRNIGGAIEAHVFLKHSNTRPFTLSTMTRLLMTKRDIEIALLGRGIAARFGLDNTRLAGLCEVVRLG